MPKGNGVDSRIMNDLKNQDAKRSKMTKKLITKVIDGVPVVFEVKTVTHGGRPPTEEEVCTDCNSYMEHTGFEVQHYECKVCGHKCDRISHVGINDTGERIVNRTRQARDDLRKHANSDCPFAKEKMAEMQSKRQK